MILELTINAFFFHLYIVGLLLNCIYYKLINIRLLLNPFFTIYMYVSIRIIKSLIQFSGSLRSKERLQNVSF